MSDSAQVAVVRRLYEARGNADIIRQVLAPDIRWEVVEGFPYSGIYVGLDDVLRNFLGRLFQDFESFVAVGTEFFESGDCVIALGSYTGRAKATRKEFTARFTHLWTLQGGKIVRHRAFGAGWKSHHRPYGGMAIAIPQGIQGDLHPVVP